MREQNTSQHKFSVVKGNIMSIISLIRKKKDLNFLALFNCACSPSNDRFLTKETCVDEKKDQRVGETVSFASLVVLSFQYRNRKKNKKGRVERE